MVAKEPINSSPFIICLTLLLIGKAFTKVVLQTEKKRNQANIQRRRWLYCSWSLTTALFEARNIFENRIATYFN